MILVCRYAKAMINAKKHPENKNNAIGSHVLGTNGCTPMVKVTVASRGDPISNPIEPWAAIKNNSEKMRPTGKTSSYMLLLLVRLSAKIENNGSKMADNKKPMAAGNQFGPAI